MKVRSRFCRKVASLLGPGMVAFILVGCNPPPVPMADYRLQHRVYAEEKVFSLTLPLPASGHLSPSLHRQNIERFASDYIRRGHGPLLVSQNGGGNTSRESQSMVARTLYSTGVPEKSIFFQARNAQQNVPRSVELSYSGYVARVPTCGDWSGQTGFDPSNLPHTDFGCSVQRNVGLMIANPGDLSVSGGRLHHDSQTSDRVIRTYRRGGRLGTEVPSKEQKDFADVK